MTKPTEFAISVKSDDPKKKQKTEDAEKDKDRAEGSSKSPQGSTKKDGKEDEAEELASTVQHDMDVV